MLLQILLQFLGCMIIETANTTYVKTDAAVHLSVLRRGMSANYFGFARCLVTLLQLQSPGFHHFVRILQNPAALLPSATSSCSISFSVLPSCQGLPSGASSFIASSQWGATAQPMLLVPPQKGSGGAGYRTLHPLESSDLSGHLAMSEKTAQQ